MKSHLEVCLLFVNTNKEKAEGSRMYFLNNKIFTFGTILAQKFKDKDNKDSIIVNETKYSTTSTKHLFYLKSAIRKRVNKDLNIYIIKERVPRGTEDLKKYINTDKIIKI